MGLRAVRDLEMPVVAVSEAQKRQGGGIETGPDKAAQFRNNFATAGPHPTLALERHRFGGDNSFCHFDVFQRFRDFKNRRNPPPFI